VAQPAQAWLRCGEKDEACVKTGIDKVADQLK
jgi:hypothetical protein